MKRVSFVIRLEPENTASAAPSDVESALFVPIGATRCSSMDPAEWPDADTLDKLDTAVTPTPHR